MTKNNSEGPIPYNGNTPAAQIPSAWTIPKNGEILFVQITSDDTGLYGLTRKGEVWRRSHSNYFGKQTRWERIKGPKYEPEEQ